MALQHIYRETGIFTRGSSGKISDMVPGLFGSLMGRSIQVLLRIIRRMGLGCIGGRMGVGMRGGGRIIRKWGQGRIIMRSRGRRRGEEV